MVNQAPHAPLRWIATLAICAAASLFAVPVPLAAQGVSAPLTVSLFAGAAGQRQATDGTGASARFYSPAGVIVDGSGNLIVADTSNNLFRKITPGGIVTTFAGTAFDMENHPINIGTADGTGPSASFHIGEFTSSGAPYDTPIYTVVGSNTLGIDAAGNIYFADTLSNTIRKITPGGSVTTIAGGANQQGAADGAAAGARFVVPAGVASDSAGNVYVADSGNNTIRKVSGGTVSTLAGVARAFGSVDGNGTVARFTNPSGIAIDSAGNLYITDTGNHTIRKISAGGVVSTLAGSPGVSGVADGNSSQARFNAPTAIAVDASGNVYVADTGNNAVRKITPAGTVATIAGTKGVAGSSDGVGTAAQFNQPGGITVDASGAVIIADTGNNTLRRGVAATNSGSLDITAIPPARVQAIVNTTVTLKVAATGNPSPTYQWSKDGSAIAGATSSTLTLPGVTSVNAGSYSVVVTSGSVTFNSGATLVQVFPNGTVLPGITLVSQPSDRTVNAGQSVTFAVEATSSQSLLYQWTKNGSAIGGATGTSYTINSAQAGDAGLYVVNVTDGTNSVSTAGASLNVLSGTPNVAPVITAQPVSQSAATGAAVTFTVAATGTPAPTFQWRKDGTNLANNATASGVTTATLTLTNVSTADAGNYTVVASNAAGTVVSSGATLTISSTPPPPPVPTGPTAWLVNLSVRTVMQVGQGPLIVGFSVTGGAKDILVRGVGPTLADYGVSGTLADPQLEVHPNNVATPSLVSDDWNTNIASVIASVAFPLRAGSKDAAFVQSMQGLYSVWERPTGTGAVLVEAYDVNPGSSAQRLANVSARNRVGTGSDILIEGFSIRGTGKKRLLIRAVGPTLAALGVPNVLADPKIEVYNSSNAKVAENDTWDASLASVFQSVGAFALNTGSKDAAMIVELDANANYTVQCKGSDGGTGEAMVEVYELP